MKCATCNQELPPDKLEQAGKEAIEIALRYWREDIYDPHSRDRTSDATRCKAVIDLMIRVGLGWTWEDLYSGDGAFEWCGAFAAKCWSTVKPEIRKRYFASTYRLDRYAQYLQVSDEVMTGRAGRLYGVLDENSKRDALPFEPRPGDILIIGYKGYGQHICLVESYDAAAGMFHTIEGNGNGTGPNGEHQQGVVRGLRPVGKRGTSLWCARRLIRPSVDDLV